MKKKKKKKQRAKQVKHVRRLPHAVEDNCVGIQQRTTRRYQWKIRCTVVKDAEQTVERSSPVIRRARAQREENGKEMRNAQQDIHTSITSEIESESGI